MRSDDFDFDLPRKLIAQHPAVPRDAARLLVVGNGVQDRGVRDLPALLRPGDVMVVNDTRVIPARLFGRRGAANVEVTLTEPEETAGGGAGGGRWRAFARPAKRLRPGDRIEFGDRLSARVAAKGERGEVTLVFDLGTFDPGATELRAKLERVGAMPLPPYIRRARGGSDRDRDDYQTVFAARDGAVAAPTAGLHFTPELLAALDARGVARVVVTLHVGAGTFLPVTAEDPRDHRMHAEWGEITPGAAAAVNAAKAQGGRVVALGSTALRLLETAADDKGDLHPFTGKTDIFILPGYRFRIVDLMLTNFHLPRSTLFMLVCAFAGTARMKRAYAHAMEAGYRFYSYGDACLLAPEARP
ncbi:MAG: tRNA preQ1(34) S-adenosylmethionine ribosyltransferase-isomerase QueA [Proteobacteria bacterium]|nr:tRNA preQ1(34) S-adenosylmethionine ribosyltransferase-isomerase QueA [Pseudomonadota bacterium]